MTESRVLVVHVEHGERRWRCDWRANLPTRKACEHAGHLAGLVPGLARLRFKGSGEALGSGSWSLASAGVVDGDVFEVYYAQGEG